MANKIDGPVLAACEVPKSRKRTLGTRAPAVTSPFLQGAPIGLRAFLQHPACAGYFDLLFGKNNDVARVAEQLRKSLSSNFTTCRPFKRWMSQTWFPAWVDPIHRGRAYWLSIGAGIWSAYAEVIALRSRTKRTIKREIQRLAKADRRRRTKMLTARRRRKQRRLAEQGIE